MDEDSLLLNLDASLPSHKPTKSTTPKKQWRQQAKKRENSTVSQNTQQADSNVRVEKEKERVPLKRMTQTGDAAARAAASEPTIPDLDADCTPPLNNEDSCILLDALKSARKQEQRLAQECQRDDSDSDPAAIPSGQEKATAKGKRTQGRVPDPGTTQKTGDYSRKDRMHSKPSAHVPKAITTELFGSKTGDFEALGIQKVFGEHLVKNNYKKPTAIQQAVLPLLLKGRDVLVRAPTGTGKTLAYLAPMLQQLGTRDPRVSRSDGCRAIIITPTRELTLQVYAVACELAKRYIWLVPGLLIGGENRHHEKQRLRKGVVILVATPGRLLDHLESTTAFSVAHLQWLVLDEADRLLDLGFQKSLSRIVELLEARSAMSDVDRQSVLVSATLHSKLGTVAAELLNDPVAVGLQLKRDEDGNVMLAEDGPAEGQFQLPKSLQQLYMEVPVRIRLPALLGTIRLCFARTPKCKVVVFVATCHGVDFLYAAITDTFPKTFKEKLIEHTVCKLHGDMEAGDRNRMMADFRSCESGMLLCTDVAARGLDFPAVTHIIQNDPPGDVPDYVQRVGRAARMGRRGVALLMLAPQETDYTKALEAVGVAIAQQKLFPSLDALPKPPALSKSAAAEADARRRCFQVAMDAAHHCQARMMDVVAADKEVKARARDAFQSYVGAYATHASHLKSIFHVRKLHLGHVAHSFGLKAQPTSLGKAPAKRKAGKGGAEKGGKSKGGNAKKKRRKAQD